MIQRIRRINPFQAAKFLAVLYGTLSLCVLPILFVVLQRIPAGRGFSPIFLVAVPVVYGVIGYIGTLIMTALYNLVAGWIGGIELDLESAS